MEKGAGEAEAEAERGDGEGLTMTCLFILWCPTVEEVISDISSQGSGDVWQ